METVASQKSIYTSSVKFKEQVEFPYVDLGEKWSDPGFKMFFEKAHDGESIFLDFLSRLAALSLLVVFSPAMLFVAIGIKLTMPGKIFYKQTRVGKNNKSFKLVKFRSMVDNAEKETGHTLSWEGDPRITPFGTFLRKSHLDELPQLLNVIFGDMNFIGPRPERPEFTITFDTEIPHYNKRHAVKPGITGLAQIAAGYDAPAQEKLQYDLTYIAYKDSAFLNLLIAYHTAKKMLFLRSTANIVAQN